MRHERQSTLYIVSSSEVDLARHEHIPRALCVSSRQVREVREERGVYDSTVAPSPSAMPIPSFLLRTITERRTWPADLIRDPWQHDR